MGSRLAKVEDFSQLDQFYICQTKLPRQFVSLTGTTNLRPYDSKLHNTDIVFWIVTLQCRPGKKSNTRWLMDRKTINEWKLILDGERSRGENLSDYETVATFVSNLPLGWSQIQPESKSISSANLNGQGFVTFPPYHDLTACVRLWSTVYLRRHRSNRFARVSKNTCLTCLYLMLAPNYEMWYTVRGFCRIWLLLRRQRGPNAKKFVFSIRHNHIY